MSGPKIGSTNFRFALTEKEKANASQFSGAKRKLTQENLAAQWAKKKMARSFAKRTGECLKTWVRKNTAIPLISSPREWYHHNSDFVILSSLLKKSYVHCALIFYPELVLFSHAALVRFPRLSRGTHPLQYVEVPYVEHNRHKTFIQPSVWFTLGI